MYVYILYHFFQAMATVEFSTADLTTFLNLNCLFYNDRRIMAEQLYSPYCMNLLIDRSNSTKYSFSLVYCSLLQAISLIGRF